ncbi:VOC family protein [Zobellella sp. DQSA1]|uniref:VOC family protein n=1 Tax=Zobellella sp. DQSA1 TaxID=3342386 RepID=UPI0035C0CCCA
MAAITHKIVPHLWFDQEAKEAAEFYTAIFGGGRITSLVTLSDTPSGPVEVVSFELLGQPFMAISAGPLFSFNESISFMVKCDDQEEIDYYWQRLCADGGQAVECGWLKDKYGLSWQIVPAIMEVLMQSGDEEQVARLTQAMLGMKKLDIAGLRRAWAGG